jgi:UDP-3-O-[3-hydroxymyristoyl] glucosamine N-acyltransferase
MADPRFFEKAGPFALAELAKIANAEIRFGDPARMFGDVQPLQAAGVDDVSFLENKLYADAFMHSAAGACLVDAKYAERAPQGMALLVTAEPYRAYARVAQAFYPKTCFTHAPEPGIHAGAHIHDTATVGAGCRVEAGAVIEAKAEIGENCIIGANSTIGPGVVVGKGCVIGANATLQFALIGNNCVIHPGVRIGQDGFGFAPGAQHIKVPQLGRVIIEDDVEIGANACVDRGAGPDTLIRRGAKIDNLVQIAHNVEIGAGCLFAAQVGISGSTKVGNYVMMGGQVGVAGHLAIGDGVQIVAQSGLMRDVAPGQAVGGSPAVAAKDYWRQIAALGRLIKPKKGT